MAPPCRSTKPLLFLKQTSLLDILFLLVSENQLSFLKQNIKTLDLGLYKQEKKTKSYYPLPSIWFWFGVIWWWWFRMFGCSWLLFLFEFFWIVVGFVIFRNFCSVYGFGWFRRKVCVGIWLMKFVLLFLWWPNLEVKLGFQKFLMSSSWDVCIWLYSWYYWIEMVKKKNCVVLRLRCCCHFWKYIKLLDQNNPWLRGTLLDSVEDILDNWIWTKKDHWTKTKKTEN